MEVQSEFKILVVEDRPHHLEDVKRLIDSHSQFVTAEYATTLEEALQLAGANRPDGVLSDAHFPARSGGAEEPNGIQIIDYAMREQIPFTIVTSTYHHDGNTEPVNQRSRNSGMELVDNAPGEQDGSKRWQDGLATLAFLIDSLRKGLIQFGIVKYGGSDGQHIGMVRNEDGEGIKFELPPYKPNALDHVKAKLGLK